MFVGFVTNIRYGPSHLILYEATTKTETKTSVAIIGGLACALWYLLPYKKTAAIRWEMRLPDKILLAGDRRSHALHLFLKGATKDGKSSEWMARMLPSTEAIHPREANDLVVTIWAIWYSSPAALPQKGLFWTSQDNLLLLTSQDNWLLWTSQDNWPLFDIAR